MTALTAIGTSERAWLRRVAVITMSPVLAGCVSVAWSWTAAPSVAPGVGWAELLSVSVVDCDVLWPMAGDANVTNAADSSHTDLRMSFSPVGASSSEGG